jgi:DNA-binding NarL/FixJ family response regulator
VVFPPVPRPRVLVIDDNLAMVERVTRLLKNEFEIVGSAGDGAAGVDAAIRLLPDAIVLDLQMPELNGIQVAETLRARQIVTPIVLLTIVEDAEIVRAAGQAGVLGYVTKRRMATDLPTALHSVLAGRWFASPILTDLTD